MKGPVLELPLRAIGSCRGDPNNVDVAAATAQGIPVLRAPGRNADAVAELTVALLLAVNRGVVRADRDVREDQTYRDGHDPLPAVPGLAARRPHRRDRRPRRRSGGRRSGASRGSGCASSRYDPYCPDATHSLDDLLAEADVVSMHAMVTPGDDRA